MKTHVVKKLMMTKMKPSDVSNSLFSFGVPSPARSRMIKPSPPMVCKRKKIGEK